MSFLTKNFCYHHRAQKDVDQQIKDGKSDVNLTEEAIKGFFLKTRYLGRLLDFEIEGSDLFLNFQEQLEILDPDPKIGSWNVQKTFDSLAPSCDELLLVCRFRGVERKCSEFFKTRRTGVGSCCVFNFARPLGTSG